jgi:hypothetical protein
MKKAIAKLVKHITADGLMEMHDHIPLGKEYEVDLDSIENASGYNVDKQVQWQRLMISTTDLEWLPLELLELDNVDYTENLKKGD